MEQATTLAYIVFAAGSVRECIPRVPDTVGDVEGKSDSSCNHSVE
jgi:hypothetical protein